MQNDVLSPHAGDTSASSALALNVGRISEVHVHTLRGPLQQRFGWSLNWTETRETTVVEVRTDGGLTGWGEGKCSIDVLQSRKEAVVGRSPFEVEAIIESLRAPAGFQERPGPPTCPGLDIALWDLIGKATELPVSRLIGRQYRDRIGAYCTALYRKDWPDLAAGLAEEAVAWKERGFRAMKMKIGYSPEIDTAIVGAVRNAIGSEVGLAVDSNCAYDGGTALRLGKRLEQFDLLWWEEPVLADDFAGYRRLREGVGIPLAGGETKDADWLIQNYLQPRIVDVLQPDLENVGLTGARMLTRLCWLAHLQLVPHNWGSALRTAAALHWMSTMPPLTPALSPPLIAIEFDQTESPFRDAIVEERIALDPADGSLRVPDGPGLGVTVNREALERFTAALSTCC
jgi:D-galactarolactone cycloisomerase